MNLPQPTEQVERHHDLLIALFTLDQELERARNGHRAGGLADIEQSRQQITRELEALALGTHTRLR